MEKLLEIAFHFKAKNDFFKHYKNKKVIFLNQKIQNKWTLNTTLLKEGKSIEIQERKTTAEIKGNYFVK